MAMELVAPITATYFAWPHCNGMLALYVLHYINRAVVQPLRSPTRSPLHAVVVVCAVFFNAMNGFLLGTWLRGEGQVVDAPFAGAYTLGLAVFAAGLAGNIWHDNVLMQLRRAPSGPHIQTSTSHYRIPYGGLYTWISYPNYLCECTSTH